MSVNSIKDIIKVIQSVNSIENIDSFLTVTDDGKHVILDKTSMSKDPDISKEILDDLDEIEIGAYSFFLNDEYQITPFAKKLMNKEYFDIIKINTNGFRFAICSEKFNILFNP